MIFTWKLINPIAKTYEIFEVAWGVVKTYNVYKITLLTKIPTIRIGSMLNHEVGYKSQLNT
jgi:hypothetical protein